MTDHECACSKFGPGPHPVDARHPNPRACEHSDVERAQRIEEAARGTVRAMLDGDDRPDDDVDSLIWLRRLRAALDS